MKKLPIRWFVYDTAENDCNGPYVREEAAQLVLEAMCNDPSNDVYLLEIVGKGKAFVETMDKD